MGLDYVLQHPDHRFLPTEEDKVRYFSGERNLPTRLFPTKTYAGKGLNTDRCFIDKYPIRIDRKTGTVAFCFIDDGAFGGLGFETWLSQYDTLIRALGSDAEVVYVSPDKLTFEAARRQFGQHFAGAAGPSSEDPKAYFELRKDFELAGLRGRSKASIDEFKRLRKLFTGDAFEAAYSAWVSQKSQPVASAPGVALVAHHLAFSYRFFGVSGVKA